MSDVEKAVIGSVLLDSSVLPFAMAEISSNDFLDPELEVLWQGMIRMRTTGEPIDTLTVSGNMTAWGVKRLTAADLWKMIDTVPHAHSVASYAKQVRDNSLRRALVDAGRNILDGANSGEQPGEVIANTINSLREVQRGATGKDLQAKALIEVLDGVDDYDWVIPGLLERKDRFVLTGTEGAGKSTFVRQLAVLSAAGIHPTTFEQIDPVKTLIVDAENTEQQWRRATRSMADKASRIGTVDPRLTVRLACSPRLDLTRDAHLGQVHRLIDEHEPDVLFVGPLYRLTSRAINNDDDAAPLLSALDTLRDRGVALVMEAHAGHALGSGGEREMRPRGSAALMGWPEFGMGIRQSKLDPTSFDVVRWRGDRDQRAWPRFMRRGGDWPWTPTEL
jgi:replicative DNA helicase